MGRKLEGRAAMVLTENRVHRGTPQEARDSDTGHFFKVGDVVEIGYVYINRRPEGAPSTWSPRVDVLGQYHDGRVMEQFIPLNELQFLD